MRTTLAVKEELIEQVKALSGVKTKKEAVEIALEEFIKRRKCGSIFIRDSRMG